MNWIQLFKRYAVTYLSYILVMVFLTLAFSSEVQFTWSLFLYYLSLSFLFYFFPTLLLCILYEYCCWQYVKRRGADKPGLIFVLLFSLVLIVIALVYWKELSFVEILKSEVGIPLFFLFYFVCRLIFRRRWQIYPTQSHQIL